MHSTLHQKQNDEPHDVLVVAPDVALVVPTDEELSRLAQTMRDSSSSQIRSGADFPAGATIPPVDTTFRPSAVGDVAGRGRAIGGRAARVFTAALLLALCTGAAAFAWQSYRDEAESMIAQWVPQRVLSLIPLSEMKAPAAQPAPLAVAAATADTPAPQPAPPAAPQAAAPAAASPSVESVEQLRSMVRDLASAEQEIQQLKASIEELKAGQQQMTREIARASEAKPSEAKSSEAKSSEAKPSEAKASEIKPSEPNLRPRLSALAPRPAAARARKPVPPLPPPQSATYPALPPATPYVPPQTEPPSQAATQRLTDPELASVPRPPMPVR